MATAGVLNVPRGDGEARRDRDSDERPRRSAEGRESRANVDHRALSLRETGRTFAAIARELGLKRSTDAQSAFVRAVKEQPPEQRVEILRRESDRLDLLEKRIRDRDREEPETMDRRLAALKKLREVLL
jgi:hypothetical protein